MLFQLPACVNATATICAPSPDSNLGRCNIWVVNWRRYMLIAWWWMILVGLLFHIL
jgi:hypothetical protein